MALRHAFEHVRGLLSHRSPLPFVDAALLELMAKDQTQLSLTRKKHVEPTLVLSANVSTSKNDRPLPLSTNHFCNYCKDTGNRTAQPNPKDQTRSKNNPSNRTIMIPCNLIHRDLMQQMSLKMIVRCLRKWILPLKSRLWLTSASNSYFCLHQLVLLLKWPLPPP